MSKAGSWAWLEYARANDDIRNRVIEEGWSGRRVEDHSFQRDVAQQGTVHQTPAGGNIHDGTVQGDTEGWNAFYAEPNGDSTRDAAHEFYGRDRLGHVDEQDRAWELRKDLAQERYGQDPAEVTHADLYGEQEPEQEP